MNSGVLSPELEELLTDMVATVVDYQRNLDNFLVEKCFESSSYDNYDDFYEAVAILRGKCYITFKEDESGRITRIKLFGSAFTYSLYKEQAEKTSKVERFKWLLPTVLSFIAIILTIVALIRT